MHERGTLVSLTMKKKAPRNEKDVGSIGSTGMAVAAILGLLLDNLIPGSPEERGLEPSLLVPEGGDIGVGND